MKRLPLILLAACAGAACGSDGSSVDGGAIDAPPPPIDGPPPPVDAPPGPIDAGPCLAAPPGDLSWLEDYQREVVGKLSGEREIFPGTTINERSTSTSRTHARDYIIVELSRWGYGPAIMPWESGANVLTAVNATGGQQSIVVIGAHFDGIAGSPAAADDGTGVAIVLAAARYFAGVCTQHRVYFMLFDQEELGLLGSDLAAADFLTLGAEIEAVHSFDMISWDADGDGAIELWDPSPSLVTAYQAAGAVHGIPVGVEACHCSDHESFVSRGFTATGVGEEFIGGDPNPHYHTPTDTYANVNFTYLAASTRMIFDVLAGQIVP